MKYATTTQLAARLAELALDYQTGRISQGDYRDMAAPIRAELQRRLKKSSMSEAA